jgi:Ca2+-binding EF-hand superfamily protein
MGCGASAAPYQPEGENQEEKPAANSELVTPSPQPETSNPVEVKVDGGGDITVMEDPDDGSKKGEDSPEDGGIKLPFVRFDKSKIPKELISGETVYLQLEITGNYLMPGESFLSCSQAERDDNCTWTITRKDGEGKLMDGEVVIVKHNATEQYMTAETDNGPITLEERNPDKTSQLFTICKIGHPLQLGHKDTVYLQSWLENYCEQLTTATGQEYLGAQRWRRGKNTALQILKKRVLDQPKTDTARKMQFQSFDTDGNGSISRAEMEYMLKMVNNGDTSNLDAIMANGEDGNLTFDQFVAWADGDGALTEAQFSHAEAIGNIAQRLSDALNEEKALIEVSAVPSLKDLMVAKQTYTTTFPTADGGDGDLLAEIDAKTSEQDGWICTNWFALFERASMENEVDLWCRCLKDSMDGWGTDEDALTFLVCTLPERLRVQIYKRFQEMCGKGLLERMQSETSGKYKLLLECQAMAPEDCKAKLLYDAIKGLGTDEDQLVRIICQMDIPERKKVKDAFKRMFNEDLVQWVKGDTRGNFQDALVLLLTAEITPFDLDADCEAIYKAMDGWGTDEKALVQLICGKTKRQMELLRDKFDELYGSSRKPLFEFVKSETSGHFQAVMLGSIRSQNEQLAECVYRTMKGWGTSERGLITMLVHLPDFKKEALKKMYKKEYKKDLIKHIKSETSGDLKEALCALVEPAPAVWAKVMLRAMKGLGTDEKALINCMCISKDDMGEVRREFKVQTEQKSSLVQWLKGDTSGDFKKALAGMANRDTQNEQSMAPIYWAQRARDAVRAPDTLKSVLVALPSPAIKRATEVYKVIYGASLQDEIKKKTEESNASWFSWTDYYKKALLNLLKSPVELYIEALYASMKGFGTDEFTLTGLVCTIPENQSDAILNGYKEKYNRTLYDHIKSETSSSYQKALLAQVSTFPESRARALYGAMSGWWTDQGQVIRVLLITSPIERANINKAYQDLFKKTLTAHIEEVTDEGTPYQLCLLALLEEGGYVPLDQVEGGAEAYAEKLNTALIGDDVDTDDLIRTLARLTPEDMEALVKQYEEQYGLSLKRDLKQRLDDDSWSGMFSENLFRDLIVGLIQSPIDRLAYSVRDCIKGWGTNETGLLTCLVHLSERKKKDLIKAYMNVPFGGDIFAAIKGDCSGDFENVLISMLQPAPLVMARALQTSMKGLGTSDDLLINWMCIAKDRMDEVREEFQNQCGKALEQWIDGDCGSADYKDLLMRLARRDVYKVVGNGGGNFADVAISVAPPKKMEDGLYKFCKIFNEYCAKKKAKPSGPELQLPNEAQQEMAAIFMFYGLKSSCCPNMDKRGVWDMTNAVGFPPADKGPDLVATFQEWDVSGTGEITWNDFVREMTTRINDPNHYNAEPLPENPPTGMGDANATSSDGASNA